MDSIVLPVNATCAGCGKPFRRNQRRVTYCSSQCWYSRPPTRHRKECPHCKTVFETRDKGQKYCSHNCWNDSRAQYRRTAHPPAGVEKPCTNCGQRKDLTQFGIDKGEKDGRTSRCLDCVRAESQERYRRSQNGFSSLPRKPEVPTGHKYCGACKRALPLEEFHKDKSSGVATQCKSCARERARLHHLLKVRHKWYGFANVDELNEWREQKLSEQDYRCAICGDAFSMSVRTCIDHSHKTGRVRGLLCNSCNGALGLMRDNAESLQRAIDYLARTEPDSPYSLSGWAGLTGL